MPDVEVVIDMVGGAPTNYMCTYSQAVHSTFASIFSFLIMAALYVTGITRSVLTRSTLPFFDIIAGAALSDLYFPHRFSPGGLKLKNSPACCTVLLGYCSFRTA
jgi:hypothetical protein